MQSSDIAGILGLLIGGAGGYYGGQKRADREKEMLQMLLGSQNNTNTNTKQSPTIDLGPTESVRDQDGRMREMLVNTLPNTNFGSTAGTATDPLAKYFKDENLAINTSDSPISSLETDENTMEDILGSASIAAMPILNSFIDQEPYEPEFSYNPLYQNEDGSPKTEFNEGGRVGLANGGNPYAGLGYSPVNNIFKMDGINTGTVAPGASSGFQSFQDGLTELDIPETSLLPDPMQTPMPIIPMGGGRGDGAANYQSAMGTDVFGNEIGGRDNPLGFGPQAAYGTDFDGTPFEDGQYRNFSGDPMSLDDPDAGFGAPFMNSLANALSNIPNITNAYGLFDYFSKENKDARKAEEKTRQEAMQLAREQEAQTLAELALQQEEERNLPDVFNPTPNIAAITTAPVSITTAQTPASVAAYNAANAGIGRAMTPTGDKYSTQTYSAAQRKANSRRAGKDKMGRSRGIGGGGAADRAAGRSAGNTGKSAGMGEGGSRHCFEPNTLIQMADGTEKKIKHIILGDNTKGGEVTGVLQFKPTDEIHEYKGVTVAGSHFVKENGKFIPVADSPHSVKIDIIPVVYSLDTSDRRIWIKDIEFADYNGDGIAKDFLANAGVDLTGFNKEVLRQVEHRLI